MLSAEEISPATVSNFKDPIPVYILYDVLAISAPLQGEVSKSLLKFLQTAASENRAVTLLVSTDKGLDIIHQMATDSKILMSALARLTGDQGASLTQPDADQAVIEESERLRQLTRYLPKAKFTPYTPDAFPQLRVLAQVGETLRRLPNRKLLVWVTGGFPLTVESGELYFAGSRVKEDPRLAVLVQEYQKAVDSLNASHISLYPIRTRLTGLPNDTYYAHTYYNGLPDFAQATGGQYLGEIEHGGFQKTVTALTAQPQPYYSLVLGGTVQKSTWIDCKIRVSVPDARLIAPKGFFAKP